MKLYVKVLAAPPKEPPGNVTALLHGTGVGLDVSAVCFMPIHVTQQPLEVWLMEMSRSNMPLPVYDDSGREKLERFEFGFWRHGFKVTPGTNVPQDELLLAAEPAWIFEYVWLAGDGKAMSAVQVGKVTPKESLSQRIVEQIGALLLPELLEDIGKVVQTLLRSAVTTSQRRSLTLCGRTLWSASNAPSKKLYVRQIQELTVQIGKVIPQAHADF